MIKKFLIILLIFVTSCVSKGSIFGEGVKIGFDPRTVGMQIDDTIMQKNLVARLTLIEKKYFLSIQVEVLDGRIFLTGKVDEPEEKIKITKLAWETKGARSVHNAIEIKGKSNALNEMVKMCKYDWVCILDVDDTWHNEKLEKQVPLMPAFDVIGTNCRYFGESQASPQIPLGIISDFDFTKVNPIINSSCMVKKELCHWESEYDGVEDYDMWLRLRKENKRFYNLVDTLVLHRIHSSSAFNAQGNNKKVVDLLEKYA